MIRLTLLLALALFAVFVLLPQTGDRAQTGPAEAPAPGTLTPEAQREAADQPGALRETADGRMVLTTTTGEELTIDLVVEPSEVAPTGVDDEVPETETAEAAAAEADTPTEAATGPRLQVTGDRVNFRAGPSTDNEILATLDAGTEVELIERVADGWAHLRVIATGLTGYMSGDFLAPAN